MAKSGEVVLSATERMLVEKQKAEIRRMRMSKEQLELFRFEVEIFPVSLPAHCLVLQRYFRHI